MLRRPKKKTNLPAWKGSIQSRDVSTHLIFSLDTEQITNCRSKWNYKSYLFFCHLSIAERAYGNRLAPPLEVFLLTLLIQVFTIVLKLKIANKRLYIS